MKAAELEGADLDYWVAQAEGLDVRYCSDRTYVIVNTYQYSPSTRWAEGGPIIERERIELLSFRAGAWEAQIAPTEGSHYIDQYEGDAMKGATPLVAAMRAYVASKFGEEVQDAESIG
jgi:hypothetical protein